MPNDFSPRSANSRPLKVGEIIRHALSEIFLRGESHVPVLDSASITVSEVRISPDLKNATAYVMPLAGSNKELIMEALATHSGQVRKVLAGKITLKFVPKIYYKLDASFEEAGKINLLLKGASAPPQAEE